MTICSQAVNGQRTFQGSSCIRTVTQMAFSHSQTGLKLAVARTLEASYSTDQTLTAKLFREAGPLKLSVDHRGNASLDGKAGSVSFSVSQAMRELGMQVRMIDISMRVDEKGLLHYTASFSFQRALSLTTRGSLDVEKLITACSGLLCKAARALMGAQRARDQVLMDATR